MIASRSQPGTQILASSICPEPDAFSFGGCTILSLMWILLQLCWSNAARIQEDKKSNSSATRIIPSIFYLIVMGIMLLDGCWLAVLYSRGIKALLTGPTHGMVEFAFYHLMGALHIVFLLGLGMLWLWSLMGIVQCVLDLWNNQHLTVGNTSAPSKGGAS